MAIYRLERGLVVQIGDRRFAFQRQIDANAVQFEDVQTGQIRSFGVDHFRKEVDSGHFRILHNTVSESDPGVLGIRQETALTIMAFKLNPLQNALWQRRCDYVRGMRKRGVRRGQRSRVEALLPVVAERLSDQKPPSASTVMRWIRAFETHDGNTSSLVSRNALRLKKPRLDEKSREYIKTILKRYYFIRNGRSIRFVLDRILETMKEERLSTRVTSVCIRVSESTVRRIVAETDPYHRDRVRLGKAYANNKWRHCIGGIYATRPMQRVEMDHTTLDLYVIDDKHGIPLGRPVVTILIDSYSGYILALYISFEGGTIGRMAHAIKIALSPRGEWIQSLHLTNPWHAPGLWETLVVDNGLEFHSAQLRMMSMDLCFDIEYCPVRKPWFKPVVERAMLEMARILPIPGRPEKFFGVKDVIDPKKNACVMFSDLCACLTKWVVDVHPVQVNDRKLARPLDLLLEGLQEAPPPVFVDNLRSLDVIGGVAKQMTVRHTGIEMMYVTYRSRELAEMAKQIAPSFPVSIKLNAEDLGSIWVQHPRERTWINVPATNSAYASGLSLYQHKLIREYAKEKLRGLNTAENLLRAKSELQDMWNTAIRSGRKLKGGARRLALLEGTRSSSLFTREAVETPLRAEQVVTREELKNIVDEPPEFTSFNLSKKLE